MEIEFLIKWLLAMLPIIFSPGPTNIVVGGSGAQFGLYRTIPLIFGVNSTILVMALLVGSGLGNLLNQYPIFFSFLKYVGASYIVYLSYKFFLEARSAQGVGNVNDNLSYKFLDGLILQATNPKVWTMIFVMYSVFYTARSSVVDVYFYFDTHILILAILLCFFNTLNNVVWAGAGEILTKTLGVGKKGRVHNYIFSIMLFIVALWIVFG